jgi:hypothetical protein
MPGPPLARRSARRGLKSALTSLCHGLLALLLCCLAASVLSAQTADHNPIDLGRYVSAAGTFDLGYRETQFFEPHHDAAVGQWDTRVEIWLPPFRQELSWGPYIRVGGIGASQSPAWENGWLGGPGIGLQVFPFSRPALRKRDSRLGNVLGPLRLFAEYNRLDFWGRENSWRPHHQTRLGAEYWRARHVNNMSAFCWTEIWAGAWWQTANEFAVHYNTSILANSIRAGLRVPNAHALSVFTPYLVVESSLTDNRAYFWENKLVGGGGLRFAPPLKRSAPGGKWLNRFAVYGEYVHVAAYYRQQAPSSIPNHDVRAGITFSFGEWYR